MRKRRSISQTKKNSMMGRGKKYSLSSSLCGKIVQVIFIFGRYLYENVCESGKLIVAFFFSCCLIKIRYPIIYDHDREAYVWTNK